MKKINFKNILTKTFNKKSKIKKKLKKPVKKKTIIKQVTKNKIKRKKIIKKKISKVSKERIKKKEVINLSEIKNENLRIVKNNEQKPEIKKVKTQGTQITEFKKISIGGIEVETYVLKFEKDKANGMVPVNKQSHLRPLATINQVNKCVTILKSKPKIKRSMWSRRAQEYEAKISSGKIYDLTEVVRDLNKGDDLMIDQSYSERQLFEKAYERLKSELEVVLEDKAQKKIDKALNREEATAQLEGNNLKTPFLKP